MARANLGRSVQLAFRQVQPIGVQRLGQCRINPNQKDQGTLATGLRQPSPDDQRIVPPEPTQHDTRARRQSPRLFPGLRRPLWVGQKQQWW